MGILRLAGATGARLDLVQESRKVWQALASEVGETINIAVLSGRDALYLEQVMGPSALSLRNWVGQRIPLHATSDGRVLLAYLFKGRVAEALAQPWQRFTEHTITSMRGLERELAGVRERVRDRSGGTRGGLSTVATPIRNAEGAVTTSITPRGPASATPRTASPASLLGSPVRPTRSPGAWVRAAVTAEPWAPGRVLALESWHGGERPCWALS